jgi:hypothetical protein
MLKTNLTKLLLVGVIICICNLTLYNKVLADDVQDNAQLREQMRLMMQQMQELQKQVQELKHQQQQTQAQQVTPPPPPPPAALPNGVGPPANKTAALANAPVDKEPLLHEIIKGFYGTLDVSFDEVSKGINQLPPAYPYALANPANPFPANPSTGYVVAGGPKGGPVGQLGYQPQIGTNKSVLGYRGDHKIGDTSVDFLYQIETQPSITAAPGLYTSYTQQSNVVKGGIGYGDTFVGIGADKDSLDWGKVKFGTTYSPYKKSTDRFNPFSGMLGDYAVIMGNTGGDNRVEFGTRLEHSVWYESPKLVKGLFSFDVLFSPGQNRTYDNVIQSAGSPDCNGGNEPGSGNLPLACDDGGFGTAWSADVKFELAGLYVTAAYELHKDVNRNSDGVGANNPNYGYLVGLGNGVSPLLNWNQYNAMVAEYGPDYIAANGYTPEYASDIADEKAFKTGIMYTFDFGLSLGTVYEWLWRDLPANLEFQNERQRNGWWFVLSQDIFSTDNISLGWAHAGRTPGDPGGQHNYDPRSIDDTAELFTAAWKHRFDKHFYAYIDAAETINHGNAHYDLGAGGRSLTTDCHDGTSSTVNDYSSAGPTTWGGCKPIGVSVGMNYKF